MIFFYNYTKKEVDNNNFIDIYKIKQRKNIVIDVKYLINHGINEGFSSDDRLNDLKERITNNYLPENGYEIEIMNSYQCSLFEDDSIFVKENIFVPDFHLEFKDWNVYHNIMNKRTIVFKMYSDFIIDVVHNSIRTGYLFVQHPESGEGKCCIWFQNHCIFFDNMNEFESYAICMGIY